MSNFDPSSNSPELPRRTPWGLWATLGFSLLIFLVWLLSQVLVSIIFVIVAIAQNPQLDIDQLVTSLASNSLLLSIVIIVSSVVGTALTFWFAKLRRTISVSDYLGLKKTTPREALKWLLVYGVMLIISYISAYLFKPSTPDFMVQLFKRPEILPLVYLAVLVMAPIYEEFFFRGFLFEGLRYSRLGGIGAVGITAFLWAIIHLQYEVYFIIMLFIFGILLGLVRLKTDSIYLVIFIHFLNNALATIQTQLQL